MSETEPTRLGSPDFVIKGGSGGGGSLDLDGQIPSAQSHSQAEGRAATCPVFKGGTTKARTICDGA